MSVPTHVLDCQDLPQPVPYFYGWEVLDRDLPIERDDRWCSPYYRPIHTLSPEYGDEPTDEHVGMTLNQRGTHESWLIYRRTPELGSWVRVPSSTRTIEAQAGDVIVDHSLLPVDDEVDLDAVKPGGRPGDIAFVVLDRWVGLPVYLSIGWAVYRKVTSRPGWRDRSSSSSSVGNEQYARPLPLP